MQIQGILKEKKNHEREWTSNKESANSNSQK